MIVATGIMDGYTSPIEDSLLENGMFSIDKYSTFVSAFVLGGMFSSTIGGLISEWLGIKTSLIFTSQLATFGAILLVIGNDSVSMTIGRLLVGFYAGMSMSWAIVYNSEIATDSVKKLYGAILAISLRIGAIISYSLGLWISYRWLAVLYMLMIVFITLNFVFLPETPRWLRNKGWDDRANQAREYFYDLYQENTSDEVNTKMSSDSSLENVNVSFSQKISSYFVWPVLRPLLVCCTIQIFKASSGQEYLLPYSAHTLESSISFNPKIAGLLFAVPELIGGILFLWVIQRISWKKLLLVTTIFQISSNGLLSLTIYLSTDKFHCSNTHISQETTICQILEFAPLIFVAMYAFTYTFGWGSIGWWLMGEILHPHYNRVSAGIVTLILFSIAYLNTQICPIVEEHFGSYTVFFINAIVCLIGFILQRFY
ncbi:Sugar transporter ERD6-like 6 [Oopsacas minuta]|uniref:Sugar transporter ERD6-like 6 n=1 Tax=Oopsacas minuta TaxID=111878 RepID=A0AAV7KEL8_9METZ|nr:Sugar transporter ERD6-like 6 [Oopsacas minuta]